VHASAYKIAQFAKRLIKLTISAAIICSRPANENKIMQLGSSFVVLLVAGASLCYASGQHSFQEVMDVIEEKQVNLSQHNFFKYLADDSIPASKRIQFVPYWSYFALAAADVLDSWIRIPNPQTDLERRVNVFIDEDNFHYNLFLHDVETVLGYTPSRFGSYGAILRHLWGDDSKAVRMLIYAWGSGAKKSKDPMVAMATFEAVEAGLKDIFDITYSKLFKGEGGYPGLKYFGQTHVDLETNHTVTGWFKEGEQSTPSLNSYEITEETKRFSIEVVEDMFYW
jgi:hypothetical protein